MDTRYGVAAVTYRAGSGSEDRDGLGDTTTTMLGCRCTDDNGMPPIRIQCAFALKSAAAMAAAAATAANRGSADPASANYTSLIAPPDLTFDVVFQQRSTANYMTCAMTQVCFCPMPPDPNNKPDDRHIQRNTDQRPERAVARHALQWQLHQPQVLCWRAQQGCCRRHHLGFASLHF